MERLGEESDGKEEMREKLVLKSISHVVDNEPRWKSAEDSSAMNGRRANRMQECNKTAAWWIHANIETRAHKTGRAATLQLRAMCRTLLSGG